MSSVNPYRNILPQDLLRVWSDGEGWVRTEHHTFKIMHKGKRELETARRLHYLFAHEFGFSFCEVKDDIHLVVGSRLYHFNHEFFEASPLTNRDSQFILTKAQKLALKNNSLLSPIESSFLSCFGKAQKVYVAFQQRKPLPKSHFLKKGNKEIEYNRLLETVKARQIVLRDWISAHPDARSIEDCQYILSLYQTLQQNVEQIIATLSNRKNPHESSDSSDGEDG